MRPFFCTLDCEYCVSFDCPYRKRYVADNTTPNRVSPIEETVISKVFLPTEVTRKEIEESDECTDCPFNDTDCPGGMWCTME